MAEKGPIILAERPGVLATPQKGDIVVDGYEGVER